MCEREIYDDVLAKGGIISFEFDQGDPKYRLSTFFKTQRAVEGGICSALSCHWIGNYPVDVANHKG